MAKKPQTTIDDKDLLVGELKKRYHNNDLFGEKNEWDGAYIQANLKDELRPYQKETLAFFHNSQSNPKADINFRHLLFNMATGAGKTMIMASLMLYFLKKRIIKIFYSLYIPMGFYKKP